MVCVFFGHGDCPASIKSSLFETIKDQIERGTLQFYVGNHGNFDRIILSCLRELKVLYPEIRYSVVLAYLPKNPNSYQPDETIFPAEMESAPRRFAIDFRNRWMVNHADLVIAYITRSFGGAAKFVNVAKCKKLPIIYLEK